MLRFRSKVRTGNSISARISVFNMVEIIADPSSKEDLGLQTKTVQTRFCTFKVHGTGNIACHSSTRTRSIYLKIPTGTFAFTAEFYIHSFTAVRACDCLRRNSSSTALHTFTGESFVIRMKFTNVPRVPTPITIWSSVRQGLATTPRTLIFQYKAF